VTPIAQLPPLEPDPEDIDHLEENEPSLPDEQDAAQADLARADQEQAR
jgi:hypothetical protein